jgi:hypothetical protein
MSTAQPPIYTDESHTLVRVRQFMRNRRDLHNFLIDIAMLIEREGVTGTLLLDFGQGHFGSARLEEKVRIEANDQR